jgi:hypothetical protein
MLMAAPPATATAPTPVSMYLRSQGSKPWDGPWRSAMYWLYVRPARRHHSTAVFVCRSSICASTMGSSLAARKSRSLVRSARARTDLAQPATQRMRPSVLSVEGTWESLRSPSRHLAFGLPSATSRCALRTAAIPGGNSITSRTKCTWRTDGSARRVRLLQHHSMGTNVTSDRILCNVTNSRSWCRSCRT